MWIRALWTKLHEVKMGFHSSQWSFWLCLPNLPAGIQEESLADAVNSLAEVAGVKSLLVGFGDPGNLHPEAALWQSVVKGFNDMVLGVLKPMDVSSSSISELYVLQEQRVASRH